MSSAPSAAVGSAAPRRPVNQHESASNSSPHGLLATMLLASLFTSACGDSPAPKSAAQRQQPRKDQGVEENPSAKGDEGEAVAEATTAQNEGSKDLPPSSAVLPTIVVAETLSTPESALYDDRSDVYLVSNIAGSPLDKDDNGYISRVTPRGTTEGAKWIDGSSKAVELHAPKGLALLGDALAVADIDHVRFFDRDTGAPLEQIAVPGATFLNDVAPSLDGSAVFVTDTGMQLKNGEVGQSDTDAVYRVTRGGQIEVIIRDAGLGGPNGIVEGKDGQLTVVNFGDGAVWRIEDWRARPIVRRVIIPAETSPGQLDGILALEDEDFLLSSWGTGQVHRLHNGELSVALGDTPSPADIGFDSKRGVLLVPLFLHDKLVVAPPRRLPVPTK